MGVEGKTRCLDFCNLVSALLFALLGNYCIILQKKSFSKNFREVGKSNFIRIFEKHVRVRHQYGYSLRLIVMISPIGEISEDFWQSLRPFEKVPRTRMGHGNVTSSFHFVCRFWIASCPAHTFIWFPPVHTQSGHLYKDPLQQAEWVWIASYPAHTFNTHIF